MTALAFLRRLALAALLALCAALPAAAQDDPHATLDGLRAELDQIEAALARDDMRDDALLALRARLEPVRTAIDGVTAGLAPRLQAIDDRLKALGEPPKDGEPAESEDVSRERTDLTKTRQGIDEVLKRAQALTVQIGQIDDRITERRRDLFTGHLLERSRSVLDPGLWIDVVRNLPGDLRAIGTVSSTAWRVFASNLDVRAAAVLGVAIAVAVLLVGPIRRFLNRLGQRFAVEQIPRSRLRRSTYAVWMGVVTAGVPTLAAILVYMALSGLGLLTAQAEMVGRALVVAIGFVACVQGLVRAILAPGKTSWRLPSLDDEAVASLQGHPLLIAMVASAGTVVETINRATFASLSASIATNAAFAIANVATFGLALRTVRKVSQAQDGASTLVSLGRGLAWIAIAAVLVAAAVGYVALARFVAIQVIWLSSLGALLYLLLIITDDLFTVGFAADTPVGRVLGEVVGLRARAIEQIGIILSGVTNVALILVAAILALAPWGFEANDALGWARSALFGLQLGDIRISISSLVVALVILIVGVLATRAVQRWLSGRLLPRTALDSGLQNSISTGVGYLGMILAGVIAVSYLGLSLANVAIVAGALSVGIGFGLQSIVNNFVSGLILLVERPVKVGDWVVFAEGEGNIRRISVRATEIELFDQSTLIVPNSELITRNVKNWTHQSRVGRLQITLSVGHDADPDVVREILERISGAHAGVLKDPAPVIVFDAITDTGMRFLLFAFTSSPRNAGNVKSDLQFALVRELRARGIRLSATQSEVTVHAAQDLREMLGALAQARAQAPAVERGGEERPAIGKATAVKS